MPAGTTRVIALGLGPIGQAVAREIADAPDLELVGAVDPAPRLTGRDLGRILRRPALAGTAVAASLPEIRKKADVAAHMSASRFPDAADQLAEVLERGLAVVSTCEEMIAAPWRFPERARELDRAAHRAGVAALGTGINPGFVMDLLPAALVNVCVGVRRIHVARHVDTSTRRSALQEKTGAGISTAEFRSRVRENRIGHVGLRDSLIFLMNHLPLQGDVGPETIRPILAEKAIRRGRIHIRKGDVAGVHQVVKATAPASRRAVATFDLKMAFGLKDPHDEVRFDGDPPIHLRVEGGVPGDRATVGAVLSTIRFAADAPPGLGV